MPRPFLRRSWAIWTIVFVWGSAMEARGFGQDETTGKEGGASRDARAVLGHVVLPGLKTSKDSLRRLFDATTSSGEEGLGGLVDGTPHTENRQSRREPPPTPTGLQAGAPQPAPGLNRPTHTPP